MTQNKWDDYSSIFNHDDLTVAFSNRNFSVAGKSGHISFVSAVGLDPDKLAFPKQIHSGHVEIVYHPGIFPNTDGVISPGGSFNCSVQVADCLPVFLTNPKSRTVGLVHAGWRGLVLKILPNTINSILQIGESLSDFTIVIGPSIQACCFEVRNDIIDQFDPTFYMKNSKNRFSVDLQKWAVQQLVDSGIIRSQVFLIDKCTFCNQNEYHSYRRNGPKAGRMIAIIGWR
jgi:YfiH family protein